MIDIENDFVILDTETTSLDVCAEIVELSIIDKHRNTQFDSFIKPKGLFSMMWYEFMAFQTI